MCETLDNYGNAEEFAFSVLTFLCFDINTSIYYRG